MKFRCICCFLLLSIILFCRFSNFECCQTVNNDDSRLNISIVPRSEWGARDPKLVERFDGLIPFVIIHHSYRPAVKYDEDGCAEAMRAMQNMHQIKNGWNDIGYSFAICGDGRVYQGRGYNVIGAHAPRYNDKSIGICLIGDWTANLPPTTMLELAKDFIVYSLENGYLSPNYKLLGHRQVRDTECPGHRLYAEIQTWPHYSSVPTGPNDTVIPY